MLPVEHACTQEQNKAGALKYSAQSAWSQTPGPPAQVLGDGRLAPLAQLGQHLAPDDALVLAAAATAERRWREADPKVGLPTGGM
jgi:hypothetical protein